MHKAALVGHQPEVPADAEVLSVGLQHGQVTAWYLTSGSTEKRTLLVIGTGWEFTGPARFIGTVQQGAFVWHVFDPTHTGGPG